MILFIGKDQSCGVGFLFTLRLEKAEIKGLKIDGNTCIYELSKKQGVRNRREI